MHETGETDQFQLLEEKVDSLIGLITELKNEKALLTEQVQVQAEKIADLSEQIQGLKTAREKAKQKIISMLEKIERIDV
jgi:hypothetical protein